MNPPLGLLRAASLRMGIDSPAVTTESGNRMFGRLDPASGTSGGATRINT